MTTSPKPPVPTFATRQQVTAALERAAVKAHVLAEQTGTQLVQRLSSAPSGKSQS